MPRYTRARPLGFTRQRFSMERHCSGPAASPKPRSGEPALTKSGSHITRNWRPSWESSRRAMATPSCSMRIRSRVWCRACSRASCPTSTSEPTMEQVARQVRIYANNPISMNQESLRENFNKRSMQILIDSNNKNSNKKINFDIT